MNRRAFLSTTATAGAGVVVGEAALEAWDRLTWKRRLFPGWSPRYDGEALLLQFPLTFRPGPVVTFERLDGKGECVEVAHELTYRTGRGHDELSICTTDGRRLLLKVASPRMGGRVLIGHFGELEILQQPAWSIL